MSVVDIVREAERKADELKAAAGADAERMLAEAEETAKKQSEALTAAAKRDAAEQLAEARKTAESDRQHARELSEVQNRELAQTAAANQSRAQELILSLL